MRYQMFTTLLSVISETTPFAVCFQSTEILLEYRICIPKSCHMVQNHAIKLTAYRENEVKGTTLKKLHQFYILKKEPNKK